MSNSTYLTDAAVSWAAMSAAECTAAECGVQWSLLAVSFNGRNTKCSATESAEQDLGKNLSFGQPLGWIPWFVSHIFATDRPATIYDQSMDSNEAGGWSSHSYICCDLAEKNSITTTPGGGAAILYVWGRKAVGLVVLRSRLARQQMMASFGEEQK